MIRPLVTLPEFRREARARLPRELFNFGDGGSETETTLRRNRRAIRRLAIRQDILVDARQLDTTTTLLGVPLSWPVVIAPMGGLVLFHEEGDVEMGRGAERADTLQFLSGATGWPVEAVAAGAGTGSGCRGRGAAGIMCGLECGPGAMRRAAHCTHPTPAGRHPRGGPAIPKEFPWPLTA